MTRRLSLSLAMLAAGVALLVTSALADPAGEAQKGGTLRIAGDEVDSLDPALGYFPDTWVLEYATCAKLFNHPDKAGAAGARAVPEVVDRFTVSEDGRTYTFTLKQTFRFHTGARVTAQSFADAFNRDAQPRLQSPATAYMHEIVGADAVIDGKARSISGIRALGRYRMQIKLTRPVGDLTARLTMPFFCPILPNTPVDPKGIDLPAGSGPYYVAERIPNQRIVLKRNPYYRGSRPAHVDEVVRTTITACHQAVEDDRVDLCTLGPGIPSSAFRAWADKYGINREGGQFFVTPSLGTWFFAFNHARPAFNGPGQIPLKKAINYAIDRPAVARGFGYVAGKRTDQMLPPAFARAESIYPLGGAAVAAARRWYARARFKPTKLTLYTGNPPPWVAAGQTLAYNLKQIGIDVDVKYFEPGVLGQRARTPGEPFDMIIVGWQADYADPAGFLLSLLADGSSMGINDRDPGIQRRLVAVNRLTGDARLRAWEDLDVYMMRNDPIGAPFMHINNRVLVSKSLGCFLRHPIYRVDIAAVCKK